ncbi:MAG: hypothetical protein HY782_19800 [Chloroflexi bacterium]|nr:hypothetical protein [Chloroflexota bacterium]
MTTVSRTISDVITSGLGEEQARQAIRESIERRLVTESGLSSYAMQRGGRVTREVSRALGREQAA